MKQYIFVCLLSLFTQTVFAGGTVSQIPREGADTDGYYWLVCSSLHARANMSGDLRSGTFNVDFTKAAVIPDSKGRNIQAGTCAWADRTLNSSEPNRLFGSFLNTGISYIVTDMRNVATDIRFTNDVFRLTANTYIIRAKNTGSSLTVKLDTLAYVQ